MQIQKLEKIEYLRGDFARVFFNRLRYRTPHFHSSYELAYIMDGVMECESLGKTLVVAKGDFLLLNPYQLHEYRAKTPNCTALFLQFSHKFPIGFGSVLGNLYFDTYILPAAEKPQESKILEQLLYRFAYYVLKHEDPLYLKTTALFSLIMQYLLNHLTYHFMGESEAAKNIETTERIYRFIKFVDEKHAQNIRLMDFAEKENLSLEHTSRLIKEGLHRNFQEYLQEVRFRHALALVHLEHKNTMDICFESGFSDVRYLNRAFEKEFGCNFKEFRSKRKDYILYFNRNTTDSSEYLYTDEEALATLIEMLQKSMDLGPVYRDFLDPEHMELT